MTRVAVAVAVLLLAACGSEPAAVVPDASDAAIATAAKAAVDDTDAALRDSAAQGTK